MDVKLPKLGEGADSGVVVNVFVKEGDTVARDQAILELENEKAVASIPSTAAGVVTKIYVKAGDKISVGQRLISLSGGDQPVAAAMPAAKRAAPEPKPKHRLKNRQRRLGRRFRSPWPRRSRRRRSAGWRANWALICPRCAAARRADELSPATSAPILCVCRKRRKKANQPPRSAKPAAEQIDFSKWGPVTKKPLTQLRQVIARRMWESWNAIPHVTQFDDADFTRLNELRKKFAPAYEKKGAKLTLTPLVLKALVGTLKKHPIFNSSLDEAAQAIVFKEYFHIGIAVDTEQGLIVPVIRDADKKSVLDLSKELEQLAQKARDRKVTAEEMKGGTFTISNQGAIGAAHFTPIINKPEVAILGLGRGAMKPVARDGKVVMRMMTPLGLSYDHRVIDGGAAARFMVDLVKAMEEFGEEGVRL